MSEFITHMTPADLIARIRQDRADFAALWENLAEAQMLQRPGPQSDWSIKDLIAHIFWWEQYAVKRVVELRAGASTVSDTDYNALNQQVFEQYKDHPLAEIVTIFEASLAPVVDQIMALTEDELNDTSKPSMSGISLLNVYISNTFGHYAEHRDDLANFVGNLIG